MVIAVTTLAAICCGWTKQTSRRELWIAMSKELSSTEHSIRQRYNELIDTLLKDAKELLPWADQLDAKTIHPNISLLLTVLGYPKEATTNKDDCHYPHPVDYAGHFTPTTQLFLPPCVQHEKKRKKTKAAQQPKK